MKNKRRFYNNKGVAMISVMIAIAFVSILASAMLYTSYMNYSMKSANLRSKENFYETDGELVKVTTSIRFNSMSASDPVNYIDTSLKRDTGDTTKYSCKKIALLVYPTSTPGSPTIYGGDTSCYIQTANNDKITFKTGSGTVDKKTKTEDASIPDGVTRYTLKDFTITQTSAQGFENSVKTDIVFDVFQTETGGSGAGGVGNMSMLLDAHISTDSGQFPSLTMTGNTFLTAYDGIVSWNGGSYTAPGTLANSHTAVKMTTESKMNFSGEHNVIFGDVYLSGSSSLTVNGDLTVFGDIILKDNATLIMAGKGKIYMMDEALPGRLTPPSIRFEGSASAAHNLYPSNLQTLVTKVTKDKYIAFSDYLNLSNNDASDDGLLKKILKKVNVGGSNVYITDVNKNINGYVYDTSKFTTNTNDFTSLYLNGTGFMGRNIGFGIVPYSYNANLNGAHSNILMISSSPNANPMTQNAERTTYIGAKPLTFNVQHGVILTKLGTAEFNYITAAKGDAESAKYNTASNPFNNITIQYVGTNFNCKVGDFFDPNCNTYVDEMFALGAGGGGGGVKKYASTIYFKDYNRDTEE